MEGSRKNSKTTENVTSSKLKMKKQREFGANNEDRKGRDDEGDNCGDGNENNKFIQIKRRPRRTKKKNEEDKSVSNFIIEAALKRLNRLGDEGFQLKDFEAKPDLWMIAFDNPIDFIQYCRKRLDHERDLLEKSRQTESQIVDLIQRWTTTSGKYAGMLEDLCKIQNHNDKLREVIMEERTNCQHLVGVNFQLESEKKMLSRKYQAALMLGKVDDKSVKHLLERNPKAVPLTDKITDLDEKIKQYDMKHNGSGDCCADPYVLEEKVLTLEKYIKTLKKQHHEEVTVLKDSISKYDMKYDSLKFHYKDALKRNSDAFDEIRDLLAASVRENLELREQLLKLEENFLHNRERHVEKFSKSDEKHCPLAFGPNQGNQFAVDSRTEVMQENAPIKKAEGNNLKLQLSKMEIEVQEKSNLIKDTLQKLLILERTCSRLKEENSALKNSHQHSLKALCQRNEILQKRCEKIDERRKLDNAGFRADVQELKHLLSTLNNNVVKCIKKYGELKAEPEPAVIEDDFVAIIDAQKSFDHYKAWLRKTDPKLVQTAMLSWTDFLEKKLNSLDEIIHSNKNNRDSDDDLDY